MNNPGRGNKILIAPLNWGLGHATRCMPIIKSLIDKGFEPVLGGDGDSLKLLQKEFPLLKSYDLPSYNIRYTKKGYYLKYRLLFDSRKILSSVKTERLEVEKIIQKENIKGIISDNRFGLRSDRIPSVFLTHQINVLSGLTTPITSKIHQKIISKFDECWVPDYKESRNLAGKLSHIKSTNLNLKYIGPISRFDDEISLKNGIDVVKKYDLMVLLSGPEPQRGLLEDKLIKELKSFSKKVLFVRGVISEKRKLHKVDLINNENIEIVNFMLQKELQKAINDSKIVVTRSGYSTIMDLERLNAKVFFIPTPGQYEQEYLAKYLEQQKIAPYTNQKTFNMEMLDDLENYSGFMNNKPIKRSQDQFPFTCFIS